MVEGLVMVEGKKAGGRRFPVEGEVGIRYGDRNYLRVEGQALISQDGHWHLVLVPEWTRDGWLSFKLYLNRKAKKNLWHIGVKDGQAAKSRESYALSVQHPGRLDWVIAQAGLYLGGKVRMKKEKGRTVVYSKSKGWIVKGRSNG